MTFLFLDLEFTGGDPRVHEICEVAATLTDADFVALDHFQSAVYWPSADFAPDAYDMHLANGLMRDMCNAPDFAGVMSAFMAWLPPGLHTLAGSSVWNDRIWLEAKCPSFAGKFHPRVLDISAYRLMIGLLGAPISSARSQHRASEDVARDIAYAKQVRQILMAGINTIICI